MRRFPRKHIVIRLNMMCDRVEEGRRSIAPDQACREEEPEGRAQPSQDTRLISEYTTNTWGTAERGGGGGGAPLILRDEGVDFWWNAVLPVPNAAALTFARHICSKSNISLAYCI